jgi:serine/threonine-protein kinase
MSENVTSAPDEGGPKPPPKAARPRSKATRPRREAGTTAKKVSEDDVGVRPGGKIAGYILQEQIGQGGMAIVYRARDERLDRMVALKLLAPGIAADVAFRQRFIRESRAAAAVDHPNIIPVYDAGDSGQALFIAMRYVHGGDVRSLLSQHGPLPPARAWSIITQVAAALDAAHAHGLVHRDVKPANMLLDQPVAATSRGHQAADLPDHVYLSDFGISKQDMSSQLTSTGQFVGTLDYIAPEQIEGKSVDGLTDLYSLGCAAFELLSGTPPFQRDQAVGLIAAHLSESPPTLSARRAGLPRATDLVLAKAMAKSPAERYATCAQFAADLGRALGLAPGEVQALAPGLPGAVGQDSGNQPKRWPATELAAQAPGPEVRQVQPVDPATMNAERPPMPAGTGPIAAAGAGQFPAGPSGQQQYAAAQYQPGQQQAQPGWPGQPQQQAQPGWPGQPQQQYMQPSGQQVWPGQQVQQPGTGPGQYGPGPYPPAQFTQPTAPVPPRRSHAMAVGVTIAAVAVIAAAVVITLHLKSTGGTTSSSGAPPSTTGVTSPANQTTTPAVQSNALSQATAINGLLMHSTTSLTRLRSALNYANECTNLSYAVNQLQQARNGRERELSQADGLSTDALQNGTALKSDLIQALQYSLNADNDYLNWANAQEANCQPGTEQNVGITDNNGATTYKDMFVGLWNPIAGRYDFQQVSPGDI